MRIYLDTSVYNRPLDDQSQVRIAEETEYFTRLSALIESSELSCLSSDILQLEVNQTPDSEARGYLLDLLEYCEEHVEETVETRKLGRELEWRFSLRSRDALHVSSAAIGKAVYFLTVDDQVLAVRQKLNDFFRQRDYPLKVTSLKTFIFTIKKGR